MGRDNRRRIQSKRRFRQIDENEIVDDLAHAAQFAVFSASAVATTTPAESGDPVKEEDDNEIEVGDDDGNDDDSDISIADASPNNDDDQDDDEGDVSESDDNESDDDLAEALMRMERASAEDEAKIATSSNPPKTENEVDGYNVPIQELESQLQIQLTVEGKIGTTTTSNNDMNISMNEVSLAGRIKNYMILGRTVVVESFMNSPSPQNFTGPLDEGSLLVVKIPDITNDLSKANWIPLGRVFEIFGPVSQPLYTIRLPSPPSKEKEITSTDKSVKRNLKKRGGRVHAEEDKAKNGVDKNENKTITVGNTGSNKASAVDNGDGSIISNKKGSDSEEKGPVVQSPPIQSQTAIKGTSEPENIDASSNTESLPSAANIVEKPLPTKEIENAESVAMDETTNNDETEPPVNDPWAMDGEYATFLSQNKDIEVYYIQDEAKMIDTGIVLRDSGKGCDASNIYDEEILDSSEAYYSDDEKEREAKSKKKGRKKKQQGNNGGNRYQSNQARSRNFNQQKIQLNSSSNFQNTPAAGQYHFRPPPPPPPPLGYGYSQHAGSLPSGFHRPTQLGGFPQTSTLHQYPAQSAFHGQASVPPPYSMPNQQYPYQRAPPPPPQSTSSIPPPPPPPRNPNEPPAYQY